MSFYKSSDRASQTVDNFDQTSNITNLHIIYISNPISVPAVVSTVPGPDLAGQNLFGWSREYSESTVLFSGVFYLLVCVFFP